MDDFEYYATYDCVAKYLFTEVGIEGQCFEPCVGDGAILRGSRAAIDDESVKVGGPRWWETNDIDDRWQATWHHDAANEHLWKIASEVVDIDWTVSNTPFTPAIDILDLALKHSRVGVALLLRATIHEVLKDGPRRTFFHDHPPTGILWLPRFAYQRSKSTKKWSTDSAACCWCIWKKDPTCAQFIRYAPGWVLDAIKDETPKYRARMDAIMETRQQSLLLS